MHTKNVFFHSATALHLHHWSIAVHLERENIQLKKMQNRQFIYKHVFHYTLGFGVNMSIVPKNKGRWGRI